MSMHRADMRHLDYSTSAGTNSRVHQHQPPATVSTIMRLHIFWPIGLGLFQSSTGVNDSQSKVPCGANLKSDF